jgi:hypothetical protein
MERIIVVKKLIALLIVVGVLAATVGCGGPATAPSKKADTGAGSGTTKP